MSNRTLIEINHDYAGDIDRDPDAFLRALRDHLRSAPAAPYELRPGIHVLGVRHHTSPFSVEWGAHRAQSRKDDRPSVRKLVTLPAETDCRIERYRIESRVPNNSDAMRDLIILGLEQHERKQQP